MLAPDELNPILERIAKRQQTEMDIAVMRQWLNGGQIVSQQSKYVVNLGQTQGDIHIGDRIYHGADAEAIREIVRSLLQELETPVLLTSTSVKSVDELVEQLRLRLHDDIQRLHGTMPVWDVDHWVDLGELFVDVNILEQVNSSRKPERDDLWQDFSAGVQEYSSYRSLDRIGLGKQQWVSGLTVLAKNTNLMVVGKPGSGKTTYLQHILTECNEGRLQPHRIPVLIKLREFIDDGRRFEYSLEHYLTQQWRFFQAETELVLSQGKALILLDGLDEVTGADGRAISKQIKRFARTYPQTQVVVTSRTQHLEDQFDWISIRFQFVEVADFNETQVNAFAEHWFKIVCSHAEEGQAKAQQFLHKLYLEENKPIRELAITPILLSLTCAVFQAQGKFYSKRSKLYEEGLELLLEKWDKSREIERDEIYRELSPERKLKLLSYLAVKKFEQQQYVLFEQEEIEGYIAEFLEISQRDSRVVLRAIEAQHGLLIERAQKVWSFSHLTFQEYLVAKWFCAQDDLEALVSHLKQENWHEILVLSTEILPNADNFLQLLKQAVDCLEHMVDDLLIENFLSWLSNKVLLVLTEAPTAPKPAALRAFYFETVLGREWLGREWQYRSLAHRLGLDAIWIGSVWEFDLSLIACFWEGVKFASNNVLEHHCDSVLDYAKRFGTNVCKHGSFNPKLQVLEELRDCLPNSNADLEVHYEWWQTQGQNWLGSLAIIIFKQRNIDILVCTRLSELQQEALKIYYKANWTLISCLNSNCTVSNKIREEIEETLLLPLAEIEKRNHET